uniref:tRNA selenocysteine-associated protein 1 n=2 Tax=Clastoptera arizonana TaxID=38151 RepID=A0A1B6CK13_9HEMI
MSQVWMGSLEPYMTESFIMNAFHRTGEKPLNVKIVRNKQTGEPGGYCFVYFHSEKEATDVILKLNGKLIPNTTPAIRFRLNKAGPHSDRIVLPPSSRELSICVGDLSHDVDDYNLYKTFASRYESIRTAKVVLNSNGFSKGYGFIRFANEEDAKHCITHMNGYKGLGTKPLQIVRTVPRSHRQSVSRFHDFSDDGWQSYSPWKAYYEDPSNALLQSIESLMQQEKALAAAINKDDDLELIEHNTSTDVDGLNREIVELDYNIWDALESSKWLPFGGNSESYGQV